MSQTFDIVIVGGGAAGIGAARRLSQTRLKVLLLEAGTRLGGRAWTQDIDGLTLDMGCGWLHSADRNAWVHIAQAAGVELDQSRAAWGTQYNDLGFSSRDRQQARKDFEQWSHRLANSPPVNDCAANALDPRGEWNTYIRSIVGFISGAPLEKLSAADYVAYDENSTDNNWRTRAGLGAMVVQSLPSEIPVRFATPVESLVLTRDGVALATPTGTLQARAAILTVSTTVLAGGALKLPRELDPWREAARQLPLGGNEKLFLAIQGESPFEAETQVIGNPREALTASYYIRPFGWPVIECFFGGESARLVHEQGPADGFAFALEQLGKLFGAEVRQKLRPMVGSSWSRSHHIGGAYSYALPGQARARRTLAQPLDRRVFFAGEATSTDDFSTVHGALASGVRAAVEASDALTC